MLGDVFFRLFPPFPSFSFPSVSLASKWPLKSSAFLLYLQPRERVRWLQSPPISVKRNLKIEANVVVSECILNVTVQLLIKFYEIIRLHFISRERDVSTHKNSPLVTAWRLSVRTSSFTNSALYDTVFSDDCLL